MNKPGDLRARLARAEEEARLTRAKFELLEIASTDERLKPGEFRFLSRLLKHLDKKSWTARVSDERMIAEVPKCGDSSVCNSHRKALAAAGWFAYEPGSGKRATVYRFPEKPPYDAIKKLDARQRALADRRGGGFGHANAARDLGGKPPQGWAANHLRGGPRTNPGVGAEPGIPCTSSLSSSPEDPSDSIPDPNLCAECDEEAVTEGDDGWRYCRQCADRYGFRYSRQDAAAQPEDDG